MSRKAFAANNSGRVLGGISTGQDVAVSIALKPTSSIRLPRRTIDVRGNATTIETTGRHDPCVGIRATPIAEAMLACVLMDHALRHRAQCADVTPPTQGSTPQENQLQYGDKTPYERQEYEQQRAAATRPLSEH